MSQEKPYREFFDAEVTLKLYREFDRSDFESRISFVKAEAEKVRYFFNADVFENRLNNKIAIWSTKNTTMPAKLIGIKSTHLKLSKIKRVISLG